MTRYSLEINGWKNIKVGSKIPSYCETCKCQSLHVCTGIKKDGNAELIRLECLVCKGKMENMPFVYVGKNLLG